MATRLIVSLGASATTMVVSKSTLTQVVGTAEAADEILLLWDKDQITSHSPTLIAVEGGTTQAIGWTIPMDLPIEAGTVIKNVGAHGVALFFS